MTFLWILTFLVAFFAASAEIKITPIKCCDNETNLLVEKKCVPLAGEKSLPVNLKCPDKYVLDPQNFPDEDGFSISPDGSLNATDFKNPVPPEDFCIANQRDDDLDESYEIAIVCFSETQAEIALSSLTFTVKAVLIFTSVVFLLLTLYVYLSLPELRETQDKVTILTLVNLTAFLFFLGIMQTQSPVDIVHGCLALAFLVYFFTMGYFAWLNCTIVNVWKTIVLRQWKIQERRWYVCNHIYGWSVPFIMTFIVMAKHYIKPSLGVTSCWFHHDHDQLTLVYLPISLMLALNVFLCIWTSLSLINNDFTPDARKALRYKCILYLKLFLLGGFTWIFEVLSYMFNDHAPSAWVWMIVDSFNCLHGVLIFFVLIIWRQRIRKELAGRRILGVYCPSKWADVEDDEEVCLENEGKGKYDLIIKTLK